MSDLFKTVLVKDPTISDITDCLDFSVMSGASSSTYQQYTANSASNSSIVFQVQLPSTSIVVDRHVLLKSIVNFTIRIVNNDGAGNVEFGNGLPVFNYGLSDSLQSFPLNKLFTTSSASINNMTVTTNTQDVVDALLRLNDSRELYRYNGMTPTLPDQTFGSYSDAILTNANPMSAYNNTSFDLDQIPRGAYPLKSCTINHINAAGTTVSDYSNISTGTLNESWLIYCQVELTEPILCLSPFIYGNPTYNCGGLVGINTITMTLNVDSSAKRFFSTSNPVATISLGAPSVTLAGPYLNPIGTGNAFANTQLLMHFLSTQPSDRIKTRCVTPYMEFPRFITVNTAAGPIASGGTTVISSQSIQLNQIPDYFIIFARKQMTQQTIQDTASFLSIQNITNNLNNTSGLLSTATQQDLWRMSVENHSTQSWREFQGLANVNLNSPAGPLYAGTGNNIPTTGSILILSPTRNMSLPDYISSSSIGQYNFQFNLTVYNQFPTAITPEVVMIAVNSGVFISEQGSSQIASGLLTKAQVLETKEETSVEPYSIGLHKRMIGGNIHNMAMGAMKGHRHMFNKVLHQIRHHAKHHVVPALDAVAKSGYARAKRQIEDFL